MLDQAERCNRCGTYPEDWLEDGKLKANPPYEVDTRRCMGCAFLDEKQDEVPPEQKGVQVYLRLPRERDEQ